MLIDYKEEKFSSIIDYIISLKERKYKIIPYKEIKNAKVAFISTIFNQINYLSSFISSIQKQKLKDFELIFIDDFSMDNSSHFILEQAKEDKRIKLINNKKKYASIIFKIYRSKNCSCKI